VLGLVAVTDLVTGPGVRVDAPAGSSQRHDCRRGERWTWDGVTFEWLHPGPGPYERDNDRSCVLLVQAGGRAALLTGDVERAAEAEILAAARPMAVDVVVAPHHGSRTSSTAAFVAATHPAWVVFSVGHRNRWNQPAGEIVERWERAGARGLRTSTSGATSFLLGPGAPPDPQEWRLRRPRVWRDP
jgi:competence protein ComEC